jgi:hypothetical protein
MPQNGTAAMTPRFNDCPILTGELDDTGVRSG